MRRTPRKSSDQLLPARWALAREFYVRGALRNGKPYFPSVRETAEFAGLSTSALRTTVKRDGWDRDREGYQADRERAFADELRKRAEEEGEMLAAMRASFDEDCFRIAHVLKEKVKQGVERLPMGLPELDQDGKPTGNWWFPRGTTYNAAQLSIALLNAQKAGRLAIGESTDNVSIRDGRLHEEQRRAMEEALEDEIERHGLGGLIENGSDGRITH